MDLWAQTILAAMTTLWSKVAAFLPQVLAAVLIVIVGYVLARALRALVVRVAGLAGVDKLSDSTGIAGVLDRANIRLTLGELTGALLFWMLMLIFLVSAAETVGLVRLAGIIDAFVLYLPKVLGALVILTGGLFLCGFARSVVVSSADSLGIEYAGALGSVAYGVLATLVFSLAIGQLELEIDILNQAITIVLMSVGLASAIAFGFGARGTAANIIAGTYVREMYQEDDTVKVGGIEGRIVSIGSVKTIVETSGGEEVSLPNGELVTTAVARKQ